MKKLLRSYIKQNIKIILLLILTMTIATGGCFAIMLSEKSEYTNHYNFIKEHSPIYGCLGKNITNDELLNIKNSENVKDVFSTISFENFVSTSDGKFITLEKYDKNILDLMKLKITEGIHPKAVNEAIILDLNNKYRVGDIISGQIQFETKKGGITAFKAVALNLKVVGKLDNHLLRYTSNRDLVYANLDNKLLPEGLLHNVFINYKGGYENIELETNKLASTLNIDLSKLNYNRDLAQTVNFLSKVSLDNPRFKNLVFSGILFSLITMIIYSKKRIIDMRLLRVVGASKLQTMFLLISEGILIGVFSVIFGAILGLLLAKFMINNFNYTLASPEIYKIMSKTIHYDISLTIYTLRIIVIPIVVSFLYQIYQVNKGFAKNEKGILNNYIDKILNTSLINKRKIINKISSINLKKYILYLIVPVILLALPISNYISVENAYESRDKVNGFGSDSDFVNRDYKIDRSGYYIPNYGFSNEEIEKIKKIEDIKDIVYFNMSNVFYISNGNELSEAYSKDTSPNIEYEFSLINTDINKLKEKEIIYGELDKKDILNNYPRVYIKNKFYNRLTNNFEEIYKALNIGDLVNIRMLVKNTSGDMEYRNIKVQVVGYLDSIKLSKYMRNRDLIGGMLIHPDDYKKISGYERYEQVFFNSLKSEKVLEKELKGVIGESFSFNSSEKERSKGHNKEILLLEIGINIMYAGLMSVFTIFSSLKIILLMRKNENSILMYIGASRKSIRNMHIIEGIKYGIISSALTFLISLYDILEEYFYLKNVYPDRVLFINYFRLFSVSLIPFIVFFLCYYIATKEFNKQN
ncbi:FtsX-like permease family protein [Peptostreptococcus sp. D1]|uniref:FtsX-like permease family protein n=1 Tax=Peptostreptococcus sp. D1 TaxID=72304 RepID=UPI0008F32BE0|nr:FtsX-like permease family protein [Peptostreptococcus sp. D1]SFE91232.1 ABC-type transport system, involved in lipoprotein release, permease component [Peptostreptococcus sp. D1]